MSNQTAQGDSAGGYGGLLHSGTAGTAETIRWTGNESGYANVTSYAGDAAVNTLTGTITIPTSDTVASGTMTSTVNGWARFVTLVTPDMQDTDSTNLVVVDPLGGTVFATGTQAESSFLNFGSVFPLTTSMSIRAIAEGTQAAAKAIKFSMHYE